ncbi:MAG: class I SAM-dependent methyltransferase [Acidobacteria bacterium]|nr:class I SAM-dependent methyltransferase [Acidobacteriota bacterium]
MFTRVTGFFLCVLAAFTACHRKEAAKPGAASQDRNLPVTEIGVTDPDLQPRLRRGFYEGTPAWKWTGKDFAVSLDAPEWQQQTFLILDFTVTSELLSEVKTVTLSAKVNGVEVGKGEYSKEGRFTFRRAIPDKALLRKPVEIEFSLDQAAHFPDGRPLGLIVVGVSLKPREEDIVDRAMQVRMARAGYQKLLAERNRQMSPEKQHELMKLFHDIPVWRHMWFHNAEIEKNPLDLWMMQEILYQLQPDFVIETGTWRGGSALYWAHTLKGMGLEKSRVITVDIQDLTKTAATHPLWKKYVTFFHGSSTDPKIVSEIAKMVRGHSVVVTLDSDHSMQHVLNELHAYSPMVPPHSYLIVEDTHIDGIPTQPAAGPGPLAAVQKFLAEHEGMNFEQDLTREAFIMTFNPGGWLRRK